VSVSPASAPGDWRVQAKITCIPCPRRCLDRRCVGGFLFDLPTTSAHVIFDAFQEKVRAAMCPLDARQIRLPLASMAGS